MMTMNSSVLESIREKLNDEINSELKSEFEGMFSKLELSDKCINIFDEIVRRSINYEIV